jgi:hypothetical protein
LPDDAAGAARPAAGAGLAGITLVIPVALFLGAAWGGPERSLLVLGPLSTFALPVIAMIAFWWDDWPGTAVRAPLSGLIDTLLVGIGGIVLTIAGQAIVAHVDLPRSVRPGRGTGSRAYVPAHDAPGGGDLRRDARAHARVGGVAVPPP